MGRKGVWIVSVVVLSACASVESMDGARYRVGSDEFRHYVEQVFRAQNHTADELAFALEDLPAAQADRAAPLGAAEASLLDACQGLNKLALSQRDGSPMGARESLAAARTAPACERARRSADEVLRALD